MEGSDHVIFLVDDDARVQESISDFLASAGIRCIAVGSVSEYLAYPRPDLPSCIVLDIELPGVNGLEFYDQIASGDHPPVVFITGHGDIPSTVRAMKRGAVDFLTKPFHESDLLTAIKVGIERDRERRTKQDELGVLRRRFAELTPREREVFPLVISGLMNKQAAAELGIREVTFQIHRAKVMQKMRAASLADLVRIAATLDIPITHSRHAGAL
ncbi:response regulator transcription factor [Mesorhizobium sp. CO1-1-8]|uniref:response regulator transcription factor n=1 Tax=Mesorhizobium sp. CO1-1-8 TaxID=2876631 RepID=UPI001CD05052|nr:response regulator [Mesorhizobium sp. CO1-1-8]MBZ9774040.1 response regulator [Mesorhizobium sp. CO1-1-8]